MTRFELNVYVMDNVHVRKLLDNECFLMRQLFCQNHWVTATLIYTGIFEGN